MLDWVVGGYMMFVGVTAMAVGIIASRDLYLFKFSIHSEADLKEKWAHYDVNGDGVLDIKELTAFIKESGVDMSRNEIAATFMALDRNFDEHISYEEFYFWWNASNKLGAERSISV
jgi:hypothetical protein